MTDESRLTFLVGYESFGVLLLLQIIILKTTNVHDYRNLVGLIALFSVYTVVRFVVARDLGELNARVKRADKLAVSYAGTRDALSAANARKVKRHHQNVRKYLQYVASGVVPCEILTLSGQSFRRTSLCGLGTARYDGQFNRTFLDVVPRFWVMWRLYRHTNEMQVCSSADCNRRGSSDATTQYSVNLCNLSGVSFPGHPSYSSPDERDEASSAPSTETSNYHNATRRNLKQPCSGGN